MRCAETGAVSGMAWASTLIHATRNGPELFRYVPGFHGRFSRLTAALAGEHSQRRRRRAQLRPLLYRPHAGLGFSTHRRGHSLWLAGDGRAADGAGIDTALHAALAADRPARWIAAHSPRDVAGDFAGYDA